MEDYLFANNSVYDSRRYLISKRITVGSFRKANLLKLAEAASTRGLEDNIEFDDNVLDETERLRINGVRMPDPFSIPENKLTNQLNNVPPAGNEDIFNFLVLKSSEYDRLPVAR